MSERWRPSVTVAAVIEEGGRFLLVEEHTPEGLKLNNPAGHLEPGETPLKAVVREALEETGCTFTPEALLGVYLARFVRRAGAAPTVGAGGEGAGAPAAPAEEDITYLRFAYRGRVGAPVPGRALDVGIVRTLWLTRDEIAAAHERHRSPLVMRCIDDHLAGRRFALDAVVGHSSLHEPLHESLHEPLRLPPPAALAAMASATMRAMPETPNETAAMLPPPLRADEASAVAAITVPADAATPSEPAAAAVGESEPAVPAPSSEAAAAALEAAPPAQLAAGLQDEPTPVAAATATSAEPTLAETAARLAGLFPALFTPGAFKAIKLRVQADIQQRAPSQFTKKQLSIFLHRHTTSTAYIRALVASPQRFDLDGQPAGEVAGEHLEAAKLELERRRQIVMQRRAAGRNGPAARGAPPRGADAGVGAESVASEGGPHRPGRAQRAPGPGVPRGGERGVRGKAHDRPPFPAQERFARGGAAQGAPNHPQPSNRPPRQAEGEPPEGVLRAAGEGAPPGEPHGAPQGVPQGRPQEARERPRSPQDQPRGRPAGDRPHERGTRPRPEGARHGPHGGPRNGPHNGPRGQQDARSNPRRFDPPRAGPAADDARSEPPLPQDPERRERAQLLRSFEGSPLTAANFCALKGLALPQFEAQVALARRERDERTRSAATPRMPAMATAPAARSAGAEGAPGTAAPSAPDTALAQSAGAGAAAQGAVEGSPPSPTSGNASASAAAAAASPAGPSTQGSTAGA